MVNLYTLSNHFGPFFNIKNSLMLLNTLKDTTLTAAHSKYTEIL